MQQLGWNDGRNVRIDYRWGAGDANNIRKHAGELVALAPDVILASGVAALGPLTEVVTLCHSWNAKSASPSWRSRLRYYSAKPSPWARRPLSSRRRRRWE